MGGDGRLEWAYARDVPYPWLGRLSLGVEAMDLIEELRADHQKLLGAFSEVGRLGVSTDEGRKKLLDTKALLLRHLKREDVELYPSLHERAKTEPRLKSIVDDFLGDMQVISTGVLSFFAKYERGGNDDEFRADANGIISKLRSRVSREELYLYKEYAHRAVPQEVAAALQEHLPPPSEARRPWWRFW